MERGLDEPATKHGRGEEELQLAAKRRRLAVGDGALVESAAEPRDDALHAPGLGAHEHNALLSETREVVQHAEEDRRRRHRHVLLWREREGEDLVQADEQLLTGGTRERRLARAVVVKIGRAADAEARARERGQQRGNAVKLVDRRLEP